MSKIESKYCLISTSYLAGLFHIFILLHVWQNFVCFGYFLPMKHIIRNLNLISIQSWTYLFNTMKVHTLHSHAYHVLLTVLFKVTLYLSFSIILNNFFNPPKQYGVLFLSWLSSMYTRPNLLYFVINVLVNIFH